LRNLEDRPRSEHLADGSHDRAGWDARGYSFESMKDAQSKGFKPAVIMKSKEGKLGYIPADRLQEASKSGLQIVPLEAARNAAPRILAQFYSRTCIHPE